jgi:hypothetical protein
VVRGGWRGEREEGRGRRRGGGVTCRCRQLSARREFFEVKLAGPIGCGGHHPSRIVGAVWLMVLQGVDGVRVDERVGQRHFPYGHLVDVAVESVVEEDQRLPSLEAARRWACSRNRREGSLAFTVNPNLSFACILLRWRGIPDADPPLPECKMVPLPIVEMIRGAGASSIQSGNDVHASTMRDWKGWVHPSMEPIGVPTENHLRIESVSECIASAEWFSEYLESKS